MNMKERIARRLCVLNYGDPDEIITNKTLPMCREPAWHNYSNDADEVLDEMLEPTEKMLDDGDECTVTGCCPVNRLAAWEVWQVLVQSAKDGK